MYMNFGPLARTLNPELEDSLARATKKTTTCVILELCAS